MGIDLLIVCAFTETLQARSLETAFKRLAISSRVFVDDMKRPHLEDALPQALQARFVLILVSPNSVKAETISQLAQRLGPAKLLAAVIKSLPQSSEQAPFRLEREPLDLSAQFRKNADIDLSAKGFGKNLELGKQRSSSKGLIALLSDGLNRPGIISLAKLDRVRRNNERPNYRLTRSEAAKLKSWLDDNGEDPASILVRREMLANERRPVQSPLTPAFRRVSSSLGNRKWLRTFAAVVVVIVLCSVGLGSYLKRDELWPKVPQDRTNSDAQLPVVAGTTPVVAGPRYALVIGISRYGDDIGTLPNATRDARLLEATLKNSLAFDTAVSIDPDRNELINALYALSAKVDSAGNNANALVYYAGHGIQVGGVNYLIPKGAKLPPGIERIEDPVRVEHALRDRFVAVDEVLGYLGDRPHGVTILVLDACRNSPLVRRVRALTRASPAGEGFVRDVAPSGTLIAYSTAPGSFAQDGSGRNSPYAIALSKAIVVPGKDIFDVFNAVRSSMKESGQSPQESNGLSDNFYFRSK